MSNTTPAGWYPDPTDPSQVQYWDGGRWTGHRAPAHPVATEPTLELRDNAGAWHSDTNPPLRPTPAAALLQPTPLVTVDNRSGATPWYGKWWVFGAVGLIIGLLIGSAAAGNRQDTTNAAADLPGPTATVTTTVTANPAPAEVSEEPPQELSEMPSETPKVGGPGDDVGDSKDTFVMPDETGKTLQAAQDDLQAVSGNPFFYSEVHGVLSHVPRVA